MMQKFIDLYLMFLNFFSHVPFALVIFPTPRISAVSRLLLLPPKKAPDGTL